MQREEPQLDPYVGPIVIGVGASAGGVEALTQLMRGIPSPLGAALVVVTHLSPTRESLLTEILARETNMKVITARDDLELQPDHVYVQPADSVLSMHGNRLRLHAVPNAPHDRNPIDVFFTSLAREARERSIGIVLSGAGSDGTLGLKSIKEEGGLTIAQGHDGTRPQYESMARERDRERDRGLGALERDHGRQARRLHSQLHDARVDRGNLQSHTDR